MKGQGGVVGRLWANHVANLTEKSPLEVGPQIGIFNMSEAGSGIPLIWLTMLWGSNINNLATFQVALGKIKAFTLRFGSQRLSGRLTV